AGLAHVDADEGEIMYHGLAPRLVVRAKSPSNRSGSKGAGRALLERGLQSQPEGTATCLHRPGCASRPMQASKPHLIHTSPRMTTEERKGTHASVPDAAPFKGSAAILLPSVILGL